ncbi:hypothetical protein [Sutterella wadsworthensis]|uniref:hypothetical protein n=1 Tax=Sutterella wadsworthensis TaxID=40545 RepID=UPI0032BF46D9
MDKKWIILFSVFIVAVGGLVGVKFLMGDNTENPKTEEVSKSKEDLVKVNVLEVTDTSIRGKVIEVPEVADGEPEIIAKDSEVVFTYEEGKTKGVNKGDTVTIKIPTPSVMTNSLPPQMPNTEIVK